MPNIVRRRRPPAAPARRRGSQHMGALVNRIGAADNSAFARLYDAVAPTIENHLRGTALHPADARAVAAGTFVEVWLLARFHRAPGTDVPAWIIGIAARRASDRIQVIHAATAAGRPRAGNVGTEVPDHHGGNNHWRAVSATHDASTARILTVLLNGRSAYGHKR